MIGGYKYQNLWHGCVGAWCPSVDFSRSTLLTDFSQLKNHGTLTNMDPGTDWVASYSKLALDFDGSNDYVSSARREITWAKPFSFSAWTRASAYTDADGRNTIIEGRTSLGVDAGFALSHDNTSVSNGFRAVEQNANGNNSEVLLSAASVYTIGNWTHVAVTVDKSGSASIWVNGRLSNTAAWVYDATTTSQATMQFGGSLVTGTSLDYHTGQLDDIRIYNRALLSSEVAMLALRRGIAFERKRHRVARLRRASSGNNMLMGCGL